MRFVQTIKNTKGGTALELDKLWYLYQPAGCWSSWLTHLDIQDVVVGHEDHVSIRLQLTGQVVGAHSTH